MDELATAATDPTSDPTPGATSDVPEAAPQESSNSDTPVQEDATVSLSRDEYTRLVRADEGWRGVSRENRDLKERVKRYETAFSEPKDPNYDPSVDTQLNPYLERRMNPVQEELQTLRGAVQYLAQEKAFEAEARRYPELEPYQDRIREIWSNSNLPPEKVFSTFKEFFDTGSDNSRVISEKRTVRLEGARASTKSAPAQRDYASMPAEELYKLYQSKDPALRQTLINESAQYGPRR